MHVSKSIFLFLLFCNLAVAQKQFHIQGHFPEVLNKEILLKGFNLQGTSLLTKTSTDDKGKFTVQYPGSYRGAALLEIKDVKSVIVLLNRENFKMQWELLEDFSSLTFGHSPENDAFGQGMAVYQKTEEKRAGLSYLLPLYEQDLPAKKFLQQQMELQNQATAVFFGSLPQASYASYYLRIRKLLADMPQTADRYIERRAEHEKQFNTLDFSDKKLLHSGLYNELLDGYFILLEGISEKKYEHINTSSAAVLKSLGAFPELKQQVAEHLFKLFEKRSLFPAAEHLALAMLSDDSCTVDAEQEALFEQYRKMAIGSIAPELVLENTKSAMTRLSDSKSRYNLVVFGSSWCPKCAAEIPKINTYYQQWQKDYDLEVILLSLDTDPAKYAAFVKDFPWISSCDFKSWEGKNARAYYVSGTPMMYLLDKDQKIVLKPVSAEHVNSWLQMKKVQKN